MTTVDQAVTNPSEVQALVDGGDGHNSAGKLRITASDRFTISFPMARADARSARLVGDIATVTLPATGTKVEAEILNTSLIGYVEVCQFRVVHHLDGPPLGLKGERRQSVRQRPRRRTTVSITTISDPPELRSAERSAHGVLGDVSTGGCGIELSKEEYRSLGFMTNALVEFEIPTFAEPISLEANRKNTRTAGTDLIWMGMSWTRDPKNAPSLEALKAFTDTL